MGCRGGVPFYRRACEVVICSFRWSSWGYGERLIRSSQDVIEHAFCVTLMREANNVR
jgi:hypothetical protein